MNPMYLRILQTYGTITGIVIMTVHECHDKEMYLCKQIVHMDSFACL